MSVTERQAPRRSLAAADILGGLSWLAAIAQGSERTPDEQEMLAPLPMIVSATRLPQSALHSPVSTTIITREMIEASGFTEIPDLFRLVPGFQVTHATGAHAIVAYHGQEGSAFPEHLEVLVDGRSIYGNLLSTVNWNAIGIELEDIEQIEVVRGPNAPVFGANAFKATINIRTRQPFAEQGTWINTTVGSADTAKLLVRHARSQGDRLDYRLSAGFRTSSGFDPPPDEGGDFDTTRLASVSFRGNFRMGTGDDFDFSAGYTGGDTGTMLARPSVDVVSHNAELHSHYAALRWTRKLGQGSELYVQATHNRQQQTDLFILGPISAILNVPPRAIPALLGGRPDQTIAQPYADGHSQRQDIEFQHLLAPSAETRAVWGGGIRLDRLESVHLGAEREVDNTSARLFGNIEWRALDRLFVNLGAMLEANEISDLHGSARIAANYRLTPTQSLRASVSHTQRSPSILEEHWDTGIRLNDDALLTQLYYSPGNLKPERLFAYELGYATALDSPRLEFDLKVFLEEADDVIAYPAQTNFPQLYAGRLTEIVTNDDRFFVQGLDGQLTWRPAAEDLLSLQWSITKSTREEARTYPVRTYRMRDDATPSVTLGLLAAHRFDHGISASLGYYRMSYTRWLGDGDDVPGYDRVDLRLAKSIKGNGWSGNVELIAQNLTEPYLEYVEDRTLFETRYFVKAGVKF